MGRRREGGRVKAIEARVEESRFTTAAARFFSRPRPERIDGISASEKSRERVGQSHPVRKRSGGGGEIDPSETVIPPFIKFYGPTSVVSLLLLPRERAPRAGFSMACDLITRNSARYSAGEEGERGSRSWKGARVVFREGCWAGATPQSKKGGQAVLMTASYSEARSGSGTPLPVRGNIEPGSLETLRPSGLLLPLLLLLPPVPWVNSYEHSWGYPTRIESSGGWFQFYASFLSSSFLFRFPFGQIFFGNFHRTNGVRRTLRPSLQVFRITGLS